MADEQRSPVFDYRALRLLMGMIAFSLPFVVSLISTTPLTSISASYHTEARDAFVGMLFIVGAFLWAYNGHTRLQALASKVAALAAIFVAIFPTARDGCEVTVVSKTHYAAAAILFSILAYFCFGPFRKKTKGKGGKKALRSKIYFVCGVVMVACMLCMLITKIIVSAESAKQLRITYWGEAVALCAFGVAWMVAGKCFQFLVDEPEALRLFGRSSSATDANV
jgi:hypothetical protein